ncbi:MAG TPA: DUF2934 domain-containing protein [Candidatus Angelobacter sp.]|nr:DUF2934 domain-containing protein [Candidatus Angelobacter sp.]
MKLKLGSKRSPYLTVNGLRIICINRIKERHSFGGSGHMSISSATENEEIRHQTTEELIRARAHQLYEERGCENGHAEEDWLQAEVEILSRQAGKQAA